MTMFLLYLAFLQDGHTPASVAAATGRKYPVTVADGGDAKRMRREQAAPTLQATCSVAPGGPYVALRWSNVPLSPQHL